MNQELINLSVDEIRKILLSLSTADIDSFCSTNIALHEICQDDNFWLLKTKQEHPEAKMLEDSWNKTAHILAEHRIDIHGFTRGGGICIPAVLIKLYISMV